MPRKKVVQNLPLDPEEGYKGSNRFGGVRTILWIVTAVWIVALVVVWAMFRASTRADRRVARMLAMRRHPSNWDNFVGTDEDE